MSDPSDGGSMLEVYPPPERRHHKNLVEVAKSPAAATKKKISALAELTANVSEDRLRASIEHLSAFPTRHSASSHLPEAAGWIGDQFRGLGYADVSLFAYVQSGLHLMNVVCRKSGTNENAASRLVCAHFDSRTKQLADSVSRAPGADDNGSGVAALIESARVLGALPLAAPIEFIATSGEEQGLWGATAYAAHVQQSGKAIEFVLNMDEIGFPNAGREIIVERDLGNEVPTNDKASQELAARLAQIATDELGLRMKLGPIERSDYMPFEARGYITIGLYESGNYEDFYHTSNDTIDHVDFSYLADMTRVAVLTLSLGEQTAVA
jgi:hypothetical protein